MLEPHLAEKSHQEEQNSNTPNPQPIQSFSMPHYTEKTGGLLHCQTPAPNLLGRCRPTGEQISSMWYSHSYPWDKSTQLPGQNDTHSAKKKKRRN
jgi:hypothetical protein